MTLNGQRCTLRPWRVTDSHALVRHANNLNVARNLRDRFPHPYTLADAHAFLKGVSGETSPTNLAIDVDDEAVGGLGYVPGADIERFSAEVGYWIGEQCWNRGIATEALALFTKHAFEELGLLRLFALPLSDNLPSIRVLEKAGFTREGTLHASCVKYGEVRDQAMYAKVNPRWTLPR